jgi:hypothetical protein
LETEETLRATNGGGGTARQGGGDAHHIHTMSEENPFLPTDDEIDDLDDGSDVSSVSNDSLKRFQNWIPLSPAQEQQLWAPFVPPREIVITIKHEMNTEAVPDWLKLPLRDPSPRGPPPPDAFAHSPMVLTDSPRTAPHPLLSPCDHLRNMSWATETTTTTMSLNRVSSQDSAPLVDRPRRIQHRGFSQPISIGSFVGQSSYLGQPSSLVSAANTTTTSSSLSLSGESYSHLRRANRKLDELVADPSNTVRRSNPLREEVLYMLDKVSGPVKRLVKTHNRSESCILHASEQGCLT